MFSKATARGSASEEEGGLPPKYPSEGGLPNPRYWHLMSGTAVISTHFTEMQSCSFSVNGINENQYYTGQRTTIGY